MSDSMGGERLREVDVAAIRGALMRWYRSQPRRLRIRSTTDPWALLVAEVMAQQTQIARVDEAWGTFMRRYPSPGALAAAPTAQVVRDWAGLGYNRRAVNLHRAAQAIEADHEGRVPDDVAALEALPGVGPYTARAVAATAFGRRVAPVDTNVRRIVGRWLGAVLGPAAMQAAADELVDPDDPATWTHASMDLGATVCTARRPACDRCPVAHWCASAGRVVEAVARNSGSVPFERTTRWLRGRIVERLRDAEDGAWTRLPGNIGEHDSAAITTAVAGLERDGLLERGPDGSVRLPSSTT